VIRNSLIRDSFYSYQNALLHIQMKKIIILLACISITFSNCKSSNDAIQQELIREVMVIHDEVMPKMDDIYKVQKQLRGQKTNVTDGAIQKDIDDHIISLEQAGEGMMDWMANLKLPSENDTRTHEEIMSYLAKEKIEIQHVSDDMNGSIQAGKELLEKLK